MKVSSILSIILALVSLFLPACNVQKEEREQKAPGVVATSPQTRAVTITRQYVCQIHSHRHVRIRASAMGYLQAIPLKERQAVKEGDLMFKVLPVPGQSKREIESAEAKHAQRESSYTKKLYEDKEFSQNELLLEAKRAQAQAKAQLAQAELDFATIKAPFDGIVVGLNHAQGSLVQEGDVLATLSDNSVVRVDFHVPEARYLEIMTDLNQHKEDLHIELMLANGKKFEHVGKIVAIEANFNHETGNIRFHAEFPNPDNLLRHGQTASVLISQVVHDAIVIPQQATFELLQKRYVFVIDKGDVVHRHEIVIQNELDDLYVIKSGLSVKDRIVLEGVGQIFDGEKVECEDRTPKTE